MDRCYRRGWQRWVHVESTNAALTWNYHHAIVEEEPEPERSTTCAENTAPESKRRYDRRSRSGLGVVWAEGGAPGVSSIDSLPCHDRFGRRFVWAASPHSSALLLGGGEEVRTGRTTEPTGPKPWRQRTEEYGTITYHCCTWGLVGSRTTDNLIGWQSTSLTQPFSKSETEVRASQWRWRSNEAPKKQKMRAGQRMPLPKYERGSPAQS